MLTCFALDASLGAGVNKHNPFLGPILPCDTYGPAGRKLSKDACFIFFTTGLSSLGIFSLVSKRSGCGVALSLLVSKRCGVALSTACSTTASVFFVAFLSTYVHLTVFFSQSTFGALRSLYVVVLSRVRSTRGFSAAAMSACVGATLRGRPLFRLCWIVSLLAMLTR